MAYDPEIDQFLYEADQAAQGQPHVDKVIAPVAMRAASRVDVTAESPQVSDWHEAAMEIVNSASGGSEA